MIEIQEASPVIWPLLRTRADIFLGTLLLGGFALLAAGCDADTSVGTRPPEVPSGEVVLYTSMPLPIVERLQGVFEGAFPDIEGNLWIAPGAAEAGGITLQVVRGRTADIEELIAEEMAADGIGADVIWLADPSPYENFKADGLLAPYVLPPGTPIANNFVDPDGFYVAGRVINMVVAWNTERSPGGVADWPALGESREAVFPGPRSGAARAAIKALLETFGEDFFRTFVAGGGTQVASNGDARDGLILGTFEAAAVLDYMVREAMEGGAPVDFVYPESGTVVIPSPLAVTAEAANPDAAKVFVDFVLSRQGQQIVVEVGSFYPARTDVAPPAGAPPLDSITFIPVDWEDLAEDVDDINELWVELFGEFDFEER